MLKIYAYLALWGRPRGTVTLQLTVFEIFGVKWQKSVSERPKLVHSKPFLTPHLETPRKISPPKGENLCQGQSRTIVQNFTLIGGTLPEISVPGQTVSEKTHTLRLTDNKILSRW